MFEIVKIQKIISKIDIILLITSYFFQLNALVVNQTKSKTGKVHKAKNNIINAQDTKLCELIAKSCIVWVNPQGKKKVKIQIKKAYFESVIQWIFLDNHFGKCSQIFDKFGTIQRPWSPKYIINHHTNNENKIFNQNDILKIVQIIPKIPHKIINHKILQNWKDNWVLKIFLNQSFESIDLEKPIIIPQVTAKQLESEAITQTRKACKKFIFSLFGKNLFKSNLE